MRASAMLCAAAALLAWSVTAITPARAQAPSVPPPAMFQPVDANSVNLQSGQVQLAAGSISIGPQGAGGLSYTRTLETSGMGVVWRDNLAGMNLRSCSWELGSGCTSTTFRSISVSGLEGVVFVQAPGGGYTPTFGEYATLTFASQIWTYTAPDGTVALFSNAVGSAFGAPITQITRPNGEIITYHYAPGTQRLQSVTNNFGYQIHIEYTSAGRKVTAINNAVEYCAPTATSCTLTQPWPTLTYVESSNTEYSVTDSLGRTTRFFLTQVPCTGGCISNTRVGGVRRPSASGGQNVTYTWASPVYPDTSAEVATVSDGVGTWTYAFAGLNPDTGVVTASVTNPLNQTSEFQSFNDTFGEGQDPPVMAGGGFYWIENALNQRTTYEWEGSSVGLLPSAITHPEGNAVHFSYDARGNITERREIAKPGSGAPDIVVSATYSATCANLKTCNRPLTYTDARGAVTTMTYDATHGGLLTMTGPAVNGAAPQSRYTYAQRNAWTRNASNQIVQQANPIWVLTETSQCQTLAPGACNGLADEVESLTSYQAGSSSAASNILPLTATTRAGDLSLSATVTTAWTNLGDVASVDGPRTDVADITTYGYDAMRQRVGELAAGSGARPAVRTTYNADGQVENVERGSASALTAAGAFTGFAALENAASLYDGRGLKTRDTFSIGGVAQSVTQYSYLANGLADCSAVRMNPAVFGSLPASACALGTQGANGPDRIAKTLYDNADRVIEVRNAVGTGLEQPTARYSYSVNGQRASVRDANNNRSAYVYDGFDRLCRLYFPVAAMNANQANTGGVAESALTCSSGGTNPDYEGYSYDANGNMVSRRLRSGETISYTYDALNRETVKDIPGGTAADVYSGYDIMGRRLYARFASAGGQGVSYAYDALSRVTSETESFNNRALSYQYDLAGNRTRVTYPDANYIAYSYDVLNRMDQVRENGATSGAGVLGVYAYDLLSRPTNLAFGNGTNTALSYAANSQNWSYTQNLASTGQDVTVDFTRNPARQTLSRAISNPLFDFNPGALNQSYARNGLNQYTAVGGVSFAYAGDDGARGNLTSDGARNFDYDLENRLINVSGSTSATLAYDPLGRLRTTTSGGATTIFLYSGDQLVAEYNGTTLLRRYAFGAGIDRPITWYEGATLATRNWLHADELGSVIATSNNAGVATIYSYGPYGEPDITNGWAGSRFRYTGQIMLFEARLYHYKARAYDPGIGRFLQTDPVGYDVGLNLYAYALNDPTNLIDPTGLSPFSTPCESDPNCATVYDGGWTRNDEATPEDSIFVVAASTAPAEGDGGFFGNGPVVVGWIGESRVHIMLVAAGYRVYTQVPARQSNERCFLFCYERRYDFVIQRLSDGAFVGIEVKSTFVGRIVPNARQVAFDAAIMSGGTATITRGDLARESISDVQYVLYRMAIWPTPPTIDTRPLERAFARHGVRLDWHSLSALQ